MIDRKPLSLLICASMAWSWSSASLAADPERYIVSSSEIQEAPFKKMELAFTSRFERRVVSDTETPGPSNNDSVYGHGKMWDQTGVEIGRFDANTRLTEVVDGGEMRMVIANYSFGDGQDSIVIVGSGKFDNDFGTLVEKVSRSYAVTGGTGRFIGATGQCDVMRVGQTDYNVACTVLIPKL